MYSLKDVNQSSLLNDPPKEEYEDEGFWWTVKKTMNPPIYAAIVSIPLAFIPGMKEYVFCDSGAVLTHNVFSAVTTMGDTASPMINLLLGSNLSRGYPPNADISW
jgi:predicted permease